MHRPFGSLLPFAGFRAIGSATKPAPTVPSAFAPEVSVVSVLAAVKAWATITCVAFANMADQDYFLLTSPTGVVTSFWFQTDGNDTENPASIAAVGAGQPGSASVEVDIQGLVTATDVAAAIVTEINTAAIGILADNVADVIVLQVTTAGTAGNSWATTEVVADAGFTATAFADGQAANPAITDGGTLKLGKTGSAPLQVTFTFSNIGEIALTLTNPASIGAETNCTATVNDAPAASIASGASDNTILDVTPTAEGAFSFTYSIANNDSSENPFNFTISGFAVTP